MSSPAACSSIEAQTAPGTTHSDGTLVLSDDWITTDGYNNAIQKMTAACHTKSGSTLKIRYYKSNFLFEPGWWRGQLVTPYARDAHVLVIGHSDEPLTDQVVERLKHPGLQKIFAINAVSTDPMVVPIPLGLTNNTMESERHPIYGNTDILTKVRMDTALQPKKNLVYLNFDIGTYPQERQHVFSMFAGQTWVTVGTPLATLDARETFLRAMRQHSFVLCPRGNGLDTHRLWEALYMGSIPIVHDAENAYRAFRGLPILFVQDWSDVTEEFLHTQELLIHSRAWDLRPLEQQWWIQQMQDAAVSALESTSSSSSSDSCSSVTAAAEKPRVRLFNLDLHISVIGDVMHNLKQVMGAENVEVVQWSISGHTWVMGKPPAQVSVVNQHSWQGIDAKMIEAFYEHYKLYLDQFDGFIVTHTPVFCLLYAKFHKPIILVNSTRYEQPYCWNQSESSIPLWNALGQTLKQLHDDNQLIVLSNNKADQEYLSRGTGILSKHVPSLCLYTKSTYKRIYDKYIVIDSGNEGFLPPSDLYVRRAATLSPGYTWQELYSFKGIIHIPYEISTMSIFEQYSANVPLIFPAKSLLKEWIRSKKVQVTSRYADPTRSIHPETLDEPLNDGDQWVDFWVDRADFYDTDNMKYITYFEAIEDLPEILANLDTESISAQMAQHNKGRQMQCFSDWKSVVQEHFPNTSETPSAAPFVATATVNTAPFVATATDDTAPIATATVDTDDK